MSEWQTRNTTTSVDGFDMPALSVGVLVGATVYTLPAMAWNAILPNEPGLPMRAAHVGVPNTTDNEDRAVTAKQPDVAGESGGINSKVTA